ncbi:MAG TPA: polyhydroxyalkanoate granule-associated phasin [Burkholderiales bacterium]|jgi:hypothetical protein
MRAAARNPWAPWMTWFGIGTTLSEMALSASQVIAQRSARMAGASVPPAAADAREFMLMGTEKLQAFGESMLAMFSPMMVNTGALSMRLSESAWRQGMRNLRLMGSWTPLAFFGPPSAWPQLPMAAASKAMGEALRQGNYFAASAGEAMGSAQAVSRAAGKVARRGIAPVHRKVKANARRLRRKP